VNIDKSMSRQPGSILQMIDTLKGSGGRSKEKDNSAVSDQKKSFSEIVESITDRKRRWKWFNKFRGKKKNQNRPCVFVPRVMFGVMEESPDTFGVPSFLKGTADHFDTLRWKYRSNVTQPAKTIIDLSRVPPLGHRDGHPHPKYAHRPLADACPEKLTKPEYDELPLSFHHYLGSWEAFICRDDARSEQEGVSFTHDRDKWERFAYHKEVKDDTASTWLDGFIDIVGQDDAKMLLKGAGVLEGCKH